MFATFDRIHAKGDTYRATYEEFLLSNARHFKMTRAEARQITLPTQRTRLRLAGNEREATQIVRIAPCPPRPRSS